VYSLRFDWHEIIPDTLGLRVEQLEYFPAFLDGTNSSPSKGTSAFYFPFSFHIVSYTGLVED